jgi:hypothetical protein
VLSLRAREHPAQEVEASSSALRLGTFRTEVSQWCNRLPLYIPQRESEGEEGVVWSGYVLSGSYLTYIHL